MPINFDHTGNLITTDDSILTLEITGALKVPTGTTGVRPSGEAGYIRYNTSLNEFEGHDGIDWRKISYTTADFNNDFATKSTTDLAEGTNLYFTNERVDDQVNNLLVAGNNITLTYDDIAGTLTIDASDSVGVATITGTPNEIEITGTASDPIIGLPNDVTISGTLTVTTAILPPSDNTGVVGNSAFTWNDGEFTNFRVNSVLEVRNAIDLADNDSVRWGSSDDATFFYDGTANDFILDLTASVNSVVFAANSVPVFTFDKTTGNLTATTFTGDLTGDVTGQVSDISNHDLGDLGDVTITGIAADEILKWNGSAWINQTLAESGVQRALTISTDPPVSPLPADMWFDSDDATLYVYYEDASSSQWVGVSGPSSGTSSGGGPFVETASYVYYGGPKNVGMGTSTPAEALEVIGNIQASEDVIAYSDERLKENIHTIENAVEKIKQLRGVKYNKIGVDRNSIGVIAQEVQNVIPEVVHTNDDTGYLSVAYGNLVGLLIEAMKEQQDAIDDQNERLAKIEEIMKKAGLA